MTRRELLGTALLSTAKVHAGAQPLAIPVNRVVNTRARLTGKHLRKFSEVIWPETVRDFAQCGIALKDNEVNGEIKLSPGGRPIFTNLQRGAVNLVLTDRIPLLWDGGRAVRGVSTIWDGYHLSVIALRYAHGHQIPMLSTNTCVHELLHVFLQDIYMRDVKWYQSESRELNIDWYATRLWLFGDTAEIRQSAEAYLKRLHAGSEPLH